MNVSGKTFLFLFGTVFLAIVLAKLTSTYVQDSIAASQAAAATTAAENAEA